ncbi:hypothetical protein H4S02_003390 [Coemansia sp. RSA 2611]|nr:hypothetical protein H4S02_003390 [Coemansia sp. RSA 2611]
MITQPPPPPHVKATPWPTPTPPSATEGYRMPGPTPTPEPSPPLSAGLLTGIALTLVVSKALLTAPAHAHDAEVGAPAKAVAVKAVAAEVGAIEAHTVEVCAVEAGTDVVELVRIPKNGDIGLGTDTLRNTNDNELPPEIPEDANKGLSLVNSERADGDHLPREEECIDDEWQLVIIERAIPDVRLEPLEHAKGAPPVGGHVDDELLHEFSERAIDEPYSPTGSVAAQPMEPPAASDAANTVKPPCSAEPASDEQPYAPESPVDNEKLRESASVSDAVVTPPPVVHLEVPAPSASTAKQAPSNEAIEKMGETTIAEAATEPKTLLAEGSSSNGTAAQPEEQPFPAESSGSPDAPGPTAAPNWKPTRRGCRGKRGRNKKGLANAEDEPADGLDQERQAGDDRGMSRVEEHLESNQELSGDSQRIEAPDATMPWQARSSKAAPTTPASDSTTHSSSRVGPSSERRLQSSGDNTPADEIQQTAAGPVEGESGQRGGARRGRGDRQVAEPGRRPGGPSQRVPQNPGRGGSASGGWRSGQQRTVHHDLDEPGAAAFGSYNVRGRRANTVRGRGRGRGDN